MEDYRLEISYLYVEQNTEVVLPLDISSLEIMLDISSLDIYIRNMAAKSVLYLKESGELRHIIVEHDIVLRTILGSHLLQGTGHQD